MPVPSTPYASARSSKPINIADQATIEGFVTAISGSGPSAVVTIQLAGSLLSVNVQAQDIGATSQTL